ncbi:MAG TPA: SrtB family sortase [Ruminococcus sp.]|nr:SrtB family sortase [Ruminococcus sp.]
MSKNQKSDSKMSPKQRNIVIVSIVCLLALIGAVVAIVAKPKEEPVQPVAQVETTPPETTEAETEAPETTEPETEPPVTEEVELELTDRAKELLAQNPDTRGWIKVEHTDVDNPVVQSEDNEYYLDHSFEKQPFRAGAVFMDYRDIFGWKESEQSTNIILYGHNMANNTMFGSLRRYRQDYSYYKTAPFIELSSNYKTYKYVIFANPITDGSAEATWRYWDMEDLSNKEEFTAYVETAKQKSLSKIPIDVEYGDKILTLSTCYSDADDSRFLIIARRLREGESEGELLAKIME